MIDTISFSLAMTPLRIQWLTFIMYFSMIVSLLTLLFWIRSRILAVGTYHIFGLVRMYWCRLIKRPHLEKLFRTDGTLIGSFEVPTKKDAILFCFENKIDLKGIGMTSKEMAKIFKISIRSANTILEDINDLGEIPEP